MTKVGSTSTYTPNRVNKHNMKGSQSLAPSVAKRRREAMVEHADVMAVDEYDELASLPSS